MGLGLIHLYLCLCAGSCASWKRVGLVLIRSKSSQVHHTPVMAVFVGKIVQRGGEAFLIWTLDL